MPVKLGLEVDYVPGREDETRALLAPYPWDYLLGSVHFIDGLAVDGEPRLVDEVGVESAWGRYFEALARAAHSGLFDSLSHPDLVKIFGLRPPPEVVAGLYARLADCAAQAGVAIEISTAGLRKRVAELYPAADLLDSPLLGDPDVRVREGRPADCGEVHRRHPVVLHAEVRRDSLGGLDLFAMALTVVERQAGHVMALLDRHREGGRRIHAPGQEDDRGLCHPWRHAGGR